MRRAVMAWGAVAVLGVVGVGFMLWPASSRVSCGPGFDGAGARCVPKGCPAPLLTVEDERGKPALCVARGRVAIAKAQLVIGPSDWEAEGRVAPRTIEAGPFWIDAFEASLRSVAGHEVADPLRAASSLSRTEAMAYCTKQGGRLPTEDEWVVAAAGAGAHRYPWGETGAVCRRAAFGLQRGPCASTGTGADTVGSHPDGDSTRGVHDLAGNVAEWVAPRPDQPKLGVAKGGSWRTEPATELRVWGRLELDPEAHDDRVGVRCAYDTP